MTFAPAAPVFTLPPHSLWRRPRRLRPPAAAVIHNGLSTEKLSTSLLAALCKTFSPSRLRTRIYNISFVRRPLPGVSAPLWGRGRAVVTPCPAPPSAGWGRAKAKADAPSRSAEQCRLCAESSAQRQKFARQSPPLPVRSPRGNLSTASPPPPKWAPRLRRREGKPPNGAPPHRNAHTPNAERKRYLHNSRTKTQRRTKRCAQFVIFVFTPCKLLHNFSTVLHRSPRNVPKRA